jgi:FkbM family methyltransferase
MAHTPTLNNAADANSWRERLDALLSEKVDAAIRRERAAFDECSAPFERRLVLFGAGAFGRHTLAGLRRVGIEPLAFADNNQRLWGQTVEGVPVLSPASAAERFAGTATFIVTIWNGTSRERLADRTAQLAALGCSRIAPAGLLFWKYPDVFLPHYPLDLPHKVLERAAEVRAAFEMWSDEDSRREYVTQVAFRLHLDLGGLAAPDPQHYFPVDLIRLSEDEVFIDCGAFDGDTIRSLVALRGSGFRRVVAFEPDPLNWDRLGQTVAQFPPEVRERIACLRQATGARRETVYMNSTGTDLSAVGAGTVAVECVRLDDSLVAESPTFIKFDIEGFELEALAGAAATIERHAPVLAVSAYHLQSHLWEIPAAIRRLSDSYSYFLRPHSSEGWDLVCYAIPRHRIERRP